MHRSFYKKIKGSNLFQYFYYFFVMSLLVTLLLGASIYIYVSQVIKGQVIGANNNTLQQLKNAQQVVLQEVNKSLANVALDSTLNNYMDYYYARDNVMLVAAQNKLSSAIAVNQYIDSIYVYYYRDEYVLSSDKGVLDLDSFYDKNFVKTLNGDTIGRNYLIARLKEDSEHQGGVSTISFVRSLPIISSGIPKAYVVMNVKSTYLQNMIDSINTSEHSNIIITDNNGSIISQRNDNIFNNEDNISPYIDLKDKENLGYAIKKVKGNRTLVSYVRSDDYDWIYVYMIPMNTVTHPIRFLLKMIIILSLLVLILSIIGSIFISKRLYSPIRSILNLFNKEDAETTKKDVDSEPSQEMKIIESNINGLISKNKSLQVVLKDYEIYLKSKFLQNIINGAFKEVLDVEEGLNYYNISVYRNGHYVSYVISADNVAEGNFEKDFGEHKEQQSMLFIYLNEAAESLIFDKHKGFIVEGNDNNVVIIVNIEEDINLGKNDIENRLYNLARQIHTLIADNLKCSFTMGVSSVYKGMEKIHDCYVEGANAVNYRLLFGYNQVIFYDRIKTITETKISYPFSIEKDILVNLKIGNREGVMNALSEFIDYVYLNPTNDAELIRHYFLQLLSGSVKCIYEMNRSFEHISMTEKEVYAAILKLNTIQALQSYFVNFYDSILKYSEEQRKAKNREMSAAIMKYIGDNLASDLCIDKLTEEFYISSSHLRKMFKDETGITIKEYIDEQRILDAKALLETTNNTITKVAENVGYASIQAFTRAFKVHTGKTPGEYRSESIIKIKHASGS